MLYRCRAGIPWRDVSERFGDFRVIHLQAHTVIAGKGCDAQQRGIEPLLAAGFGGGDPAQTQPQEAA